MRTWVDLNPPKDLDPRVVRMFKQINLHMQQSQVAIKELGSGLSPDGGSIPLFDTSGLFKLAGRPGGQIAHGDTTGGGKLVLSSTSGTPKGLIYLGEDQTSAAYDETNARLGLRTISPQATLHAVGNAPSGGSLTLSTDVANNWAGPYTGGGTPIGGTSAAALSSNDGTTSWMAILDAPVNGTNPQINGLSGTVAAGRVYQITFSAFTLSTPISAGTLAFLLVTSTGDKYQTANVNLAGLSTTPTTYTTTCSTSGTIVGTGTPNSIEMQGGGGGLYVCVSYIIVGDATVEAAVVQAATTSGENLMSWRGPTYANVIARMTDDGKFYLENSAAGGAYLQGTTDALNVATRAGAALAKLAKATGIWSDAITSMAVEFGSLLGSTRSVHVSSSSATVMDRFGVSSKYTLISNAAVGSADFVVPTGANEVAKVVNSSSGAGADGCPVLLLATKRSGQTGDMLQTVDSGGNVTFAIGATGHVRSTQATAPTIAAGAALGVTPTVAVATGSTDTAGTVQLTAGTVPTTGIAATITFNKTYPAAPKAVLISATRTGAAALYALVSNVAAATFDISFDVAPSASTRYDFTYLVIE